MCGKHDDHFAQTKSEYKDARALRDQRALEAREKDQRATNERARQQSERSPHGKAF